MARTARRLAGCLGLVAVLGGGGCDFIEGLLWPSEESASAPTNAVAAEGKSAAADGEAEVADGKAADGETKTGVEAPASDDDGGEADPVEVATAVPDVGTTAEVITQVALPPPDASPPVVPPGVEVIATVNGVALPKTMFDTIYEIKLGKYLERGREIPKSAERRFRRQIVGRLVDHERLRQQVVADGIDYDPAELQARIDETKRGVIDWQSHLERRGESEDTLRAMLIAELREVAILDKRGVLALTPAEIRADYEKVHKDWKSSEPRVKASHILIEIPEPGPGEDPTVLDARAKAEAQRVHALATAPGADFAALARAHSDGPSAERGGALGIFTRDRMMEAFSDVVFAMKPGEISEPVKTKFGYHVIWCQGQWPPGTLPLEAIEGDIRERLYQAKVYDERAKLAEELARAYPVEHQLLSPAEAADL